MINLKSLRIEKLLINSLCVFILLYVSSFNGNGFLGPLFNKYRLTPLIVSVCVFIILCIYKNGIKSLLRKENIFIGIVILYLLYVYLYYVRKPEIENNIGFFCNLLIVYNVFRFLLVYNNKKTNKIIGLIMFVEITSVMLVSGYCILFYNKWTLYRAACTTNYGVASEYGIPFYYLIGNFGTVYVAPIVALMSIDKIIQKKYWYIISLVAAMIVIFTSGYFIAILGSLLILLIYLAKIIYERIGLFKTFWLALTGIVIVILVIYVLSVFGYASFLNKIMYIVDFIRYGKSFDRLDLYLFSINGIIVNKFLPNPALIMMGNHSTILDMMSLLGLLSILLFLGLWFMFGSMKKYLNRKIVYFLLLVYLLFISLINKSMLREIIIMLFIYLPFVGTKESN